MMKRRLSVLMILFLILALPANAASLPFRDDVAAINEAAGSVLMLLVYQNKEGGYIANGSGFVAFDSRTLITNYHVVEGGDLVLAESDDGKSYFLDQVLAADREKDLAILRFKADTSLPPPAPEHRGRLAAGPERGGHRQPQGL